MDRKLSQALAESFDGIDVQQRVDRFSTWNKRASKESKVEYDHVETVNDFYDLSTELTRWGWNESIHFAPLKEGESLPDAIQRHERYMMEKLKLDPSHKVLDVGCGIGGPMRHVARATGAHVLGININEHQIKIAKKLNEEAKLADVTEITQCNFMDMSMFKPNSFDAAYAIESTAHAVNKTGAYEQIFRVLKPGAFFWGQETIMTAQYQPEKPEHQELKERLKSSMALYEILTVEEIRETLNQVGFTVLECEDLGKPSSSSVPWYLPLTGKGKLFHSSRTTPVRRFFTMLTLNLVETFRLVPKGTSAATKMAATVADASIEGGKAGIFSILGCFLAQKPTSDQTE